jgi:hypothetical protein
MTYQMSRNSRTASRTRLLRRCDLLQKRRLRQRLSGCFTGLPHHLHGRVLNADSPMPPPVAPRSGGVRPPTSYSDGRTPPLSLGRDIQ